MRAAQAMETGSPDSWSSLREAGESCGTCGCGRHPRRSERIFCAGLFHGASEFDVFEQTLANGGVSTDGVVSVACDQDILTVGSRSRGVGIAHSAKDGTSSASSAKITGITAFSQNPETICSGEYESNAAPFRWASARLRASDPGRCTVSASVNKSHSPRASRAPAVTALFFPVQPAGNEPASITRTFGNDVAISRVRSVEWSSTTMISKSHPGLRDQRLEARAQAGFFVARGNDHRYFREARVGSGRSHKLRSGASNPLL